MSAEACNCEHTEHFDDTPYGEPQPRTRHAYMAVPAGERRAQHVGLICDDCATTCLADYLL